MARHAVLSSLSPARRLAVLARGAFLMAPILWLWALSLAAVFLVLGCRGLLGWGQVDVGEGALPVYAMMSGLVYAMFRFLCYVLFQRTGLMPEPLRSMPGLGRCVAWSVLCAGLFCAGDLALISPADVMAERGELYAEVLSVHREEGAASQGSAPSPQTAEAQKGLDRVRAWKARPDMGASELRGHLWRSLSCGAMAGSLAGLVSFGLGRAAWRRAKRLWRASPGGAAAKAWASWRWAASLVRAAAIAAGAALPRAPQARRAAGFLAASAKAAPAALRRLPSLVRAAGRGGARLGRSAADLVVARGLESPEEVSRVERSELQAVAGPGAPGPGPKRV